MPELPEVETIKRSLEKAIVGKRLVGVEVRKAKVFRGDPKDIIGRSIKKIDRRGKILLIDLSEGKTLLVHFKLTGQMVWVPRAGERATVGHPIPFAGDELPAKTTHLIFAIDGGPLGGEAGKLFYNDLRQFGWIKVIENSKKQIANIIGRLGPEPLDFARGKPAPNKDFSVDYLEEVFNKTAKPIKLVLMDQEKIAGVGNIYANEALWQAKILPTRSAKRLSELEISELRRAIIKVLADGLKYGGASAADEAYIRPDATPGKYQEHFRVYQRDGQNCRRCRAIIKRINLGGRGTFYCPKCQS